MFKCKIGQTKIIINTRESVFKKLNCTTLRALKASIVVLNARERISLEVVHENGEYLHKCGIRDYGYEATDIKVVRNKVGKTYVYKYYEVHRNCLLMTSLVKLLKKEVAEQTTIGLEHDALD